MKDENEGGGEHPEGEGGDCLGGRSGGRGLSGGCWRMWPGWNGLMVAKYPVSSAAARFTLSASAWMVLTCNIHEPDITT